MGNQKRCPVHHHFVRADGSCRSCELESPAVEGAGFKVEPLPRYRLEMVFPAGEKVLCWVEGDEAEGMAAFLEEAAKGLRAAAAGLAP